MRNSVIISLIFIFGCADANNIKNSNNSVCGNYKVEAGEECDDGNDLYGDGCDPQCQIQDGWECEGSPSTCTLLCGNGFVEETEECDDGSRQNGDGCDEECQIETGWACQGEPSTCTPLCGNGFVDQNEQCDGDNLQDNTCESIAGDFTGGELSCSPSCTFDTTGCILPNCGDGIVNEGEECDDGNNSNNDACLNNCQEAKCGDGYHWVGTEECDDGNTSNVDNCTNECKSPVCGDGYTWTGMEECDDGNTTDGDGCNHLCNLEELPLLYSIDSVTGGWTQQTIYFANDPHAPQEPILATAAVEYLNQAYIFTDTTYHVLSLPSYQWIEHGQINSKFSGVPGSSISASFGMIWNNNQENKITLMAGEYFYDYFLNHSTQVITASSDNPVYIDWSNDGDPVPDPASIKAGYISPENDDGWVNIDPAALCGGGSSTAQSYGATITTGLSLYLYEASYCHQWCDMMAVSSFSPFSISGSPAPDKIRAMFYISPKLYVVSDP